jgi:hypothetical protein
MSLSRAWSFYVGFILIFAGFYLCDRSHACSPMRCPCCRPCRADESLDCRHAALVALVGESLSAGRPSWLGQTRLRWRRSRAGFGQIATFNALRATCCCAPRALCRSACALPRDPPALAQDTRRTTSLSVGATIDWTALAPLPHLHRDWAHPWPHPHRDRWARRCHVCSRTRLIAATSALGPWSAGLGARGAWGPGGLGCSRTHHAFPRRAAICAAMVGTCSASRIARCTTSSSGPTI